MEKLSASMGDLLSLCQYPLTAEAVAVDSSSVAMQKGSSIHALIAWRLLGGKPEDYPQTDQSLLSESDKQECSDRASVAELWAEKQGALVLVEKSLWVDTNRLGVDEEEPTLYPAVRVTADFVCEPVEGVLQVVDWKTGRPVGIRAENSIQLGLQGWAAWRWALSQGRKYDKIVVGYGYIDEVGDVSYRPHTHTPATLRALAGGWSKLVEPKPDTRPNVGLHCKELYCPCISTCPGVDSVTDAVIPLSRLTGRAVKHDARLSAEEALCITSDAACEHAIEVKAFAQRRLEDLDAAIKNYAKERGSVELSNGKVYRPVSSRRKNFDKKRALEAYPALGNSEYNPTIEITSWRVTNKEK